jgi:uncharacterized OB-fold protein
MIATAADPEFEPFWDAVGEGRLVVQECGECGARRWPPRPACARCLSTSVRWTEVRRTGTLYSWVVIHRSRRPDLRDRVPFTVGVVALDDDPALRFLGGLTGAIGTKLTIGQPVEVRFEPDGQGIVRPYWQVRP